MWGECGCEDKEENLLTETINIIVEKSCSLLSSGRDSRKGNRKVRMLCLSHLYIMYSLIDKCKNHSTE